ncbi:hypothetical protein CUJ83_12090 [Methanocella sp. CWC-04]|uniref:Carboxypeptidase regulatory-like domain-containing protein n=1 Tax=Methanooceanicella nereidis TaxID=2052831 RepID=A0AAP2W7Y9_9EURY|nr:hypothetical protein [Methanocella sp. CWC-04]
MQFSKFIVFLSLMLLIIPGFIAGQGAAQVVSPDGVQFLGDEDMFAAGGNSYTIEVQVTLGGGPYSINGTRVYFTSSDSSIIAVESGSYSLTDDNGIARLDFVTTDKSGYVNITATAIKSSSGISATKTFRVGGYGTLSGLITDKSYNGVQGAIVAVYNTDGQNKGSLVHVANNPQVSSDSSTGAPGQYRFDKLPLDTYYIEAQKEGKTGYLITTITADNPTVNIRIEDYEATITATPEATPVVSPEPTATAAPTTVPTTTPIVTPTSTPSPSGDTEKQVQGILLVSAIGAAILTIVILVLRKLVKK